MRRYVFLLGAILFVGLSSTSGQSLKSAQKFIKKNIGTTGITQDEAAAGIKEALSNGINKGVDMVSKENGYFGDLEIKIPFPEEAKSVESKLKAIGMGKKVDEVVLSINRAAEDASVKARDIFIAAIKQMTVTDAINIVKGNDDAATMYLKNHTTDELVRQFRPVIEESLTKVNATKYWSDVINTYNKIPMVQKVNPDLADYVTRRAIEGLFVKIAHEEKEIRQNPAARTTELLKKVFGK
jgi:hypothetical protein